VPVNAVGVALGGKSLPNLPPSMVHILGNDRRTGAKRWRRTLVRGRTPSGWCRLRVGTLYRDQEQEDACGTVIFACRFALAVRHADAKRKQRF